MKRTLKKFFQESSTDYIDTACNNNNLRLIQSENLLQAQC
ncbi:hypothetical protein C427_2820 [Paraglaciecola psychrophila 170]|uniref:Uncharacterized protein n=1 Tax=Paraglaciecola psychrophila 170 TaxID=1129794 RepID=M4RRU8_9ALTE|nr:hypothetical protein C427_2820 [Paraglaciecola psychrophila 170]